MARKTYSINYGMRIGIDIAPLQGIHALQHRVRGTGFYTKHLQEALLTYFPENTYSFFTNKSELSSNLDIVHYPYFEPFFFTLPFKKITKTVVTIHDLTPLVFPDAFPSGIKGKMRWAIQKILLKQIDGIITDSESSKKDIMQFTGIADNKISVVYLAGGEQYTKISVKKNGVLQNIKKKYNLPDKFVLYVGDVTWNKNLPRLIKATLQDNIPLVMVGKALIETNFDASNPWNQDRAEIQRLVKDEKNILRVGFVPDEDLVSIYNLATVFVMPSLYEGFGLPVLEAMQCGCPVVTSKEGSLPEVTGNACLYVDAKNVNDINNGIHSVFNNRKLQESLSTKGLLQAQKFSWKKTARDTLAVYEKLLHS